MGPLRYVNPRVAHTDRDLMEVSEINDMGHDVFFSRSDRHQGECVPRGQWHEAGARESEWSLRVASGACSIQPEHFGEHHLRYVFLAFGAGTDRGHDGQDCDSGSPKMTGACIAASPTEGARLEPLVVGGSTGCRDVIYPIPRGGLLGERERDEGEREQNEESNCSVKWQAQAFKERA